MSFNDTGPDDCPERNPDWPDEFPQGPQAAAAVLSVLWSLFFIASLSVLYWRRAHSPLRSRRIKLIAATTCGCFMSTIPSLMREAVGRDNFSCTLYLITTTLTVPAIMCPIIQRILHHKNRVQWQAIFMSRPLSQRSDEHVAEMILLKYKASSRRAYLQVSMFASVFVLLAIIYQQVEQRYHSGNCVGCEMTTEDTFLLLSFFVSIMIFAVYAVKRLPTTRAGQHDEIVGLVNVIKVLSVFVLFWFIFFRTDPGHLHTDGILTYAYILEIGLTLAVVHQVWIPVYKSFSSVDEENTLSEIPLLKVLDSSTMKDSFESFLMREFAAENLKFLSETRSWRNREPVDEHLAEHDQLMGEWIDAAVNIYYTFVHHGALLEVNLRAEVKQALSAVFEAAPVVDEDNVDLEQPHKKRLKGPQRSKRGLMKESRSFRGLINKRQSMAKNDKRISRKRGGSFEENINYSEARPAAPKEVSINVFDAAVQEIMHLLEMDAFPRFIRSAGFKEMHAVTVGTIKVPGKKSLAATSFLSDINASS